MQSNLPVYLSISNIQTPFKPLAKPFSDLFFETIESIERKFNVTDHLPQRETFDKIFLSYFFIDEEEWVSKFSRLKKIALEFSLNPDGFWSAIAEGLYTPGRGVSYLKRKVAFESRAYQGESVILKVGEGISGSALPVPVKEIIRREIVPRIRKREWKTVNEYILQMAPSKSYELVYSRTLARCKNKMSGKGKRVYLYGQDYIHKVTGLSPRMVRYCWAWLRHHGIFNKAVNENPALHHCSLWFVCTSLKQVSYFRDPKNLHRKNKR